MTEKIIIACGDCCDNGDCNGLIQTIEKGKNWRIEKCTDCGWTVKRTTIKRYEKRIERKRFYHATCTSCGFKKEYQLQRLLCPKCRDYMIYDDEPFEKETVTRHRVIEFKEEIINPSKFPKKKRIPEVFDEPEDLFDRFLESVKND